MTSASLPYRTTPYLAVRPVGGARYAVWNRFFPSVVVLNKAGLALLERLREGGGPDDSSGASAEELAALASHRLVRQGDTDCSREDFVKSLERAFGLVEEAGGEIHEQRKEYGHLYFSNSACNLQCGYCVQKHTLNEYKASVGPMQFARRAQRWPSIQRVIDQYFERKPLGGKALVSFNGGEILLEWALIRSIVEYIASHYGRHKVKFGMNSNMTLMTDEIAQFMNRHGISVHMSIDGYAEAHDRTRRYNRGQGSFDDVIRGMQIFNKHNPDNPITGFQGTIDDVRSFDPERLFAMSRYGFKGARMAPNLFGVSAEDARQAALLEARLFKMSRRRKLRFSDTYFVNMSQLLGMEEVRFFFNCLGMSGYPTRSLTLDVSTMRVTQICSFIPHATIPLSELDNDIYHPKLTERANAFILERLKVLQGACEGCDLVGVCRGSCILMGLDAENRLNEAACVYQKTLWDEFLQYAHGYMKAEQRSARRAKSTPGARTPRPRKKERRTQADRAR